MKNNKNRLSFIKDVEITEGKSDTIYSVLNNKIEKYDGVESLNWFGSNGTSVIIGHKKAVSKLKRDNPKIISIHCDNYRLALAMLPSLKERTFLMKNNNYLVCWLYCLLS